MKQHTSRWIFHVLLSLASLAGGVAYGQVAEQESGHGIEGREDNSRQELHSARTRPDVRDQPAGIEHVFPGERWQTVQPAEIGLDSDALSLALDFAMERNSSSVVVCVGGRIVAERHVELESPRFAYRRVAGGLTDEGHQREDVASVQKSIVSVLTGIAVDQGLLELDDSVQKHLGEGWSEADPDQEAAITVRHLITMTSGLNGRLRYSAPAGTVWQYNTNAYAKTMDVLVAAAGLSREELTKQWLTGRIGMADSQWIGRRGLGQNASSIGFMTSARDLARFGLLVLHHGKRADEVICSEQYLNEALAPSQEMNPSFGYLWWLNGQQFSLQPGRGRSNGSLLAAAPQDTFAALGALGRKVYVVPSMDLVVVRIGDNPDSRGEAGFDQRFWELLMKAFE